MLFFFTYRNNYPLKKKENYNQSQQINIQNKN